ncbi:MAG TPA: MFS transporter [Actinoplanes sp.]|nr:MFS transporter [Actinoplanes sp.]
MTVVDTSRDVRAATRATYVAFIGAGVALASWAARIPQIRDGLGLTPSQLGLVLLAIAAGSIVSLVLAGQIVTHFGSRRTVTAMAALLGVSLTATAVGYRYGVAPVVVSLAFFGFANGAWDVAMNVQGTVVERRLGRAIMPRFHAGFSVGTVGGALVSAGIVALHVPVTVHLIVSALVVAAVVILSVRSFVPDGSADATPVPEGAVTETGLRRALAAWSEPRTILIGIFVLAFAFTEGAGIDWINVAVIDDYGAPATVGTLAFAVFLAAMTAGRWFGPALLDKYGRVPVVRALAAISLVGLGLFVVGPNTPMAFLGALFWGLGASLGFPVGMSAAADDPAKAAARVSVVASIGYCAFLGGPPLIGFLGDQFTVRKALLAVAVLLVVAISVAGAIRPLRR